MESSVTPRKRLEIIVDTCSMGEKKMRGVSKLIQYAMAKQPPVFEDYRIVVPLQLGTETRQRLFPDFLEKELAHPSKNGALEQFYAEHAGHVRIVETDTSHAFRLFYAKKALDAMEHLPRSYGQVRKEAKRLAAHYADPGAEPVHISRAIPGKFRDNIHALYAQYEERFAEEYRTLSADSVPGNGAVKRLQRRILAEVSEPFFSTLSPAQKIMMQALYTAPKVYAAVSQDANFNTMRTDLGERAIEDYLFDKRHQPDSNNVSLVISEDRGARGSIQHLRQANGNTVFTIGSFGLALALSQLRLIRPLSDVVEPQLMEQVRQRKSWTEEKRSRGIPILETDINDPAIEGKWAGRLVEVLETGRWSERRARTEPKPHPRIHSAANHSGMAK